VTNSMHLGCPLTLAGITINCGATLQACRMVERDRLHRGLCSVTERLPRLTTRKHQHDSLVHGARRSTVVLQLLCGIGIHNGAGVKEALDICVFQLHASRVFTALNDTSIYCVAILQARQFLGSKDEDNRRRRRRRRSQDKGGEHDDDGNPPGLSFLQGYPGTLVPIPLEEFGFARSSRLLLPTDGPLGFSYQPTALSSSRANRRSSRLIVLTDGPLVFSYQPLGLCGV
jgi:hypothetical protein